MKSKHFLFNIIEMIRLGLRNLKWKIILIRNGYFLSDSARKVCLIFGAILLVVYFAIRINIPDSSLRNILGLKWYYYLTIC